LGLRPPLAGACTWTLASASQAAAAQPPAASGKLAGACRLYLAAFGAAMHLARAGPHFREGAFVTDATLGSAALALAWLFWGFYWGACGVLVLHAARLRRARQRERERNDLYNCDQHCKYD
jgi:hypothetical protein